MPGRWEPGALSKCRRLFSRKGSIRASRAGPSGSVGSNSVPAGTGIMPSSARSRRATSVPAALDAPTLTAPVDQSFDHDTSRGPLAVKVGDSETPANYLTLTATSDNSMHAFTRRFRLRIR